MPSLAGEMEGKTFASWIFSGLHLWILYCFLFGYNVLSTIAFTRKRKFILFVLLHRSIVKALDFICRSHLTMLNYFNYVLFYTAFYRVLGLLIATHRVEQWTLVWIDKAYFFILLSLFWQEVHSCQHKCVCVKISMTCRNCNFWSYNVSDQLIYLTKWQERF